jgi:glucose/arabinose dehydrogenase
VNLTQHGHRFLRRCLLVLTLLLLSFGSSAVLAQDTPTADAQVEITRNMNVRAGPGTNHAIIAFARPGEEYPVTGRSEDGNWWRIDLNGRDGWIYAPSADAVNTADVPVVTATQSSAPTATQPGSPAPTPPPTANVDGPSVRIRSNMNVRSGPGTNFSVIGSAPAGEAYTVTGKNAAESWWRIDFNGRAGWVSAPLVTAQNAANVAVVEGTTASSSPAVATTASPVSRFNPEQVQLRLEPIFSGLQQPTDLTNAGDGTGRIFVTEKSGRIRVFAGPEDGNGQTFLDIVDRVGSDGYEQGLLGLAFPPNFRSTSYFFVNYTNKDGDTIVARYRVSRDNHNRADRDSEFVVLFQQQPAPNHNGGMLTFGPDGRLWIGLGDGGGANDTFQNGQNRGTLLGSMLRLDVASNPNLPYRIPTDNPFVGDASTRDEIWAIGLRNPWRYSFDPRTGDLWIGDVGQSLFEEINFIPAAQVRRGGFNFGWPISEGRHCTGNADCDLSAFTLPIHEYGHAGNGCSVTGGRVYRGAAFPQLDGVYFFGDFCSGNVWALWRNAGGSVQTALVLLRAMSITTFGVDEGGEIYVTDFGGGVYRLAVE